MATPSQSQAFGGGNPYPTPGSTTASSTTTGQQQSSTSSYAEGRPTPSSASSFHGQPQPQQFDKYCIIHIATTCDEHGVYVTKDSAEVIEIGWVVVDARDNNLPELHHQSVLVRPTNTPITPLCTSLTTLTWDHVKTAGTFREAIQQIDTYISEELVDKTAGPAAAPKFAFVTLSPWDLRVQMPREARDKNVVLPAYLQHPVLFGLRQEYQTFQSHHPETLAFSASSLSSICAGLEVEEVRSSGKVTGGLPFHLQALAPSSPRRALEEALTLTRCLRSLVQKSRPSGANPSVYDADVLSRPLDARSDVRAFLGERSKVLHLSGLPHDTTQSELESWFTQYGGRPIAFWTLRTPEGGKPSGSGFVVFGSHEEAAESLSMNGRALNDRAIEVSPSSSRVLDRAAGSQPPNGPPLLTPFPPSKNRPRPGDWTCPSCGFSNFQRRTACFRCSYPAMGAAPDPYAAGPYGMPPNPYGGHGYGHPAMMNGPHMHGSGYGNMGGMGGSGGRGGVVPFRAGDWKCGSEGCNYHNFAKNVSCLRCGASRSNAAVVAEGGQMNNFHHAGGYHGGPPPPNSYGNMNPNEGNAYGAPPAGFGQHSFAPPPNSYGAPSPYAAAPGYQMPAGNGAGGFDARAEQAFNQSNTGNYSNGNYNAQNSSFTPGNGANVGNPGNAGETNNGGDPFAFLSSGMGNLGLEDGQRGRSGQGNAGVKSPK